MKYTSRSFAQKFSKDGDFGGKGTPSVTPWRVTFWLVFSCAVGMILTAAILALSLCWQVSGVEVRGSAFHQAEEILDTAGIREGDLMLGFDDRELESTLKEAYPILKSVRVERYLDGSVILDVRQEETLYYTCHHTNYYLISGDGMKVIGISSADDLYRAYGAIYLGLPEEASLQVGERLDFAFLPYAPVNPPAEISTYEIVTEQAEEEYAYTLELVEALEDSPFFATLDGVDTSDRYDLYFVFNGCIMIRLGKMSELERKLEQALYLVTNELSDGETPAVIDVSDPAKSTLRQNPALEMPTWCKN